MVSHLAELDIGKLESRFGRIALADAIRLNGLGLLVERAANSADVVTAPRIAWAGPHAFHEPSAGSALWFDDYACKWWSKKSLFYARAWSCYHAATPSFFEAYTSSTVSRHAIAKWKLSLAVTDAQIATALRYAVFGEGATDTPAKDDETAGCPVTKLIDRAIAAGLGISYERLTAFPFRRIVDIMIQWSRNNAISAGTFDPEIISVRIHDSACAEYFGELDRIEAKYMESANGKG